MLYTVICVYNDIGEVSHYMDITIYFDSFGHNPVN